MKGVSLYKGDCLEIMKEISDNSVDCVISDPPYGTTASSWDKILDFEKLWREYERIIKPNGAIVLFASGQFTNKLINSKPELYRYKWIWVKNAPRNFVNAKNRPLTSYEEILVFSKGITANTPDTSKKMNYYPQGLIPLNKKIKNSNSKFGTMNGSRPSHKKETVREFTNYPTDILFYDVVNRPKHPTEKPLALLEYLVNTYTKEGDLVLDNTMGSGTTGLACVNTNRRFIGIEKEDKYFTLAEDKIYNHETKEEQNKKDFIVPLF